MTWSHSALNIFRNDVCSDRYKRDTERLATAFTSRKGSEYLSSTNKSKLLLSDVVSIEITATFKRECNEALNDFAGSLRRVRDIGIQTADIDRKKALSEAASEQEHAFIEVFPAHIVEPLRLRGDSLEDTVRRLAERRKPASANGEQFRDCVIWSDVLAYYEKDPAHRPIAFIAKDSAFSADKVSLHPVLQRELNDRGITISYYPTIDEFLKAQNFEMPREDVLGGAELVVTDGWLKVPGVFRGPQFNLIAPGINVSSANADPGGVAAQRCMPCRANELLSLNSTFAGNLGLGSGPATIAGVQYDGLYYAGSIHFFGDTEIPETNSENVLLSSNFTFEGSLKGYKNNPFLGHPGDPVFDVKLIGTGTATVELTSYPNAHLGRLYSFSSLEYKFEQ